MSTIGLLASTENTVNLGRMHMRPFQRHLKTHWKFLMPGCTTPLESEDDTTRRMVVRPSKHATRRVSPPQRTQKKLIFTDASNAGLGCSLRSKLYRRALVSFGKAPSHQPFRDEGCSSCSAILQDRLQEQSSPHRFRQHLSGSFYQQKGRHKISRTLCYNVENPHLVSSKQCYT